jgi:hypothetical protein
MSTYRNIEEVKDTAILASVEEAKIEAAQYGVTEEPTGIWMTNSTVELVDFPRKVSMQQDSRTGHTTTASWKKWSPVSWQ